MRISFSGGASWITQASELEKFFLFTPLTGSRYAGILTATDYEISLSHEFADPVPALAGESERRVLIDLGVRVGFNKYRFAECPVTDDGRVLFKEPNCVQPDVSYIQSADQVLRSRLDALPVSDWEKARFSV